MLSILLTSYTKERERTIPTLHPKVRRVFWIILKKFFFQILETLFMHGRGGYSISKPQVEFGWLGIVPPLLLIIICGGTTIKNCNKSLWLLLN